MMARIVEASAHPELADRCYTQEEMRKTLIEKFYELDEIHENAIDITADSVTAAATVMDAIYNTLYGNQASQE